MKCDKNGKLMFSIILILSILLLFNNNVFAEEIDYSDGAKLLTDMEKDAKNFITTGKEAAKKAKIDAGKIAGQFKGLGQILTMIGAGVMVAVTTYMGIKYLTSGPEAQAKLKVQLIGVVVSGMVIFGAFYIWQLVIKVAGTL